MFKIKGVIRMSQPFDVVFSDWKTEKRLGNGTDGLVYTITRTNEKGEEERSILKTIRIGINRNEDKGFNSINQKEGLIPSEENYNKIIKGITDNITTIQKKDNGKYFVKYEQWETRDTSDGKGKMIMIRLEEMRSLTDLLNRFSFTLEETVSLGISLCRSLKRCRSFGYVYPNLKPENVLFDRNGVCKLGDFGSFSILEPSKTSIAFKRTQYYMAPELVSTGKINCTSDTYSLGLILYTLVNRGRLPFAEMFPQEVTINGLNRSVENRVNGLPLPKPALGNDALFAVISKACAFKPQDRYLTPDQMLADLKNIFENKPFEETKYDDIFSSSDMKEEKSEDELDKKKELQSNPKEYKADVKVKKTKNPEPVKRAPRLREEITIPNVQPRDYSKGRKPAAQRRKATSSASLYDIQKKQNKSAVSADLKKIISVIAALVFLVLMLIVSLTLRHNSKNVLTDNYQINQLPEVSQNGSPND